MKICQDASFQAQMVYYPEHEPRIPMFLVPAKQNQNYFLKTEKTA